VCIPRGTRERIEGKTRNSENTWKMRMEIVITGGIHARVPDTVIIVEVVRGVESGRDRGRIRMSEGGERIDRGADSETVTEVVILTMD